MFLDCISGNGEPSVPAMIDGYDPLACKVGQPPLPPRDSRISHKALSESLLCGVNHVDPIDSFHTTTWLAMHQQHNVPSQPLSSCYHCSLRLVASVGAGSRTCCPQNDNDPFQFHNQPSLFVGQLTSHCALILKSMHWHSPQSSCICDCNESSHT